MFLLFTLVLIVIALYFVIPPLTGKAPAYSQDREQANLQATRTRLRDIEKEVENDLISHEQLASIKEEAETTLLMELQDSDRTQTTDKSPLFHKVWTWIIAISIPVFAFLIYLSVGTPTALLNLTERQQPENQGQSLDQLVVQLEKRLAENADDEQGWLVLAQTNMVIGHFPEAVKAMENLYSLTGDTPDVLTRYADALTMANGGRFSTQSSEMLDKALKLDPNHTHALWLAGMNAYQAEEFQVAIRFFQQARQNITEDENLAQLDQLIVAARERGGLESLQEQPDAGTSGITVIVDIDPVLNNKTNPDDALFVFAKAAKGPPMPLAVSRHKVKELPLTVSLNDSMAMMPSLKLSGFNQVIVSARVSKSNQPTAQSGDLQGESLMIDPTDVAEIRIKIDQVVE